MIVPFVRATADLDCPRACAVFRLAGVPLVVVVNVTSRSDSSLRGDLTAPPGVLCQQRHSGATDGVRAQFVRWGS
jgi:hypothetical protein